MMGPPLMAVFMRSNQVGEFDVGGFLNSADEADRFRVGNGIGKGLREGAVAGKLEDAELRELEGTVDALIVIKPRAGAGQHVVEIVGVRGMVIQLERDISTGTVIKLLMGLVATGEVGEKVENVGRSHAVFEKVPAISLPLALQISGSDGDLIG